MTAACLVSLFATSAEAKTVGFYNGDKRLGDLSGTIATMTNAGWKVEFIGRGTLADENALCQYDVLYFPGGFNMYFWTGSGSCSAARRAMTRYVAKGGGAIFCGNRGGYVRSATRPTFPQVGAVSCRLSSGWINPVGDSPMAKAFDGRMQAFSSGDHLKVEVGPDGKSFCGVDGMSCGAYGEVGNGRVIVLGAHFSYKTTEESAAPLSKVLLACLDWTTSGTKTDKGKAAKIRGAVTARAEIQKAIAAKEKELKSLTHAARAAKKADKSAAQAKVTAANEDLDKLKRQMQEADGKIAALKAGNPDERLADIEEARLCRRERMYDVALEERGPDYRAGSIPRARDYVTTEPEALAYKLDFQAQFLGGKEAEKARAVSGKLKSSAAAVNKTADELKGRAKAGLEKLDLAGLKALKTEDYEYGRLVTNLTKLVDVKLVAGAKEMIAKNAPVVEAAKLERVRKELAEDAKLVPGLVADLASAKCPKRRYEAAMEIGRIVIKPDSATVAALVKALDDEDAQVRSQAAISLGWMQAKDAVPALIEKIGGSDARLSRRAVQALGQIGDDRAASALVKALSNRKDDVCSLAAIALGQMRAKSAVPALLKIVRGGLEENNGGYSVSECESAMIALGYIGDKSVVKDLDAVAEKHPNDGPRDARSRKANWHFRNPYSIGTHATTSSNYGFEWTSQMAKALIEQGGRKEKGVEQNLHFRAKDYFYRISGNCNALAGRIGNGMSAFYGRYDLLVAHLWEAGCTGIHNAWGMPGYEPEGYKRLVRELSDFDMCLIDVFSSYGGSPSRPETETRLEAFRDNPAYHGFWAEETWPEFGMGGKEFLSRIEKRYGKDWRSRGLLTREELAFLDGLLSQETYFDMANLCHGSEKDAEQKAPDSYLAPWDAGLRTLLIELQGDKLAEIWTESQDYLKARRMGCAHTYVVSTADQGRFFGDNRAFNAVDSMGLESYQSFGRSTSYWMQRYRDGNARSGMSELYNWYCPSPEHARRGFWQNAVHGKCFYNFGLMEIFKHPSGEYLWRWEEGRWDAFRDVFRRVRDNKEFYRIKPSAAKVAVLYSERASSITRNNAYQPCAVPQRADQNAMAIWVSLGQSHIQADVVYVDYVKPQKLKKYGVLVLSDAKYLTDEEAATLRAWVKEGGVLIAEGDATLFDGWTAKRRANYALADVFGADFVKADYLADDESDTFCRRRGDTRAQFKFVPGLDGADYRYHAQDSIHRDRKPVKSVRTLAFGGLTAEIDAAIGVDRVKPTTAKPVATFADGQPAILENAFGKGKCYFQCSAYPAMGHTTSEWEMMPNKWDFWPGNREMLEKLVRDGLAFAKAEQAVEAKGLSGDVEVTVDDYGDKYVVHLLDYNVLNKAVQGGSLAVPGARPIKRVFYPNTKTEVAVAGREIPLRAFSAYDMVVIEFEVNE